MRHTVTATRLLVTGILLSLPVAAAARTWRVERDGTGDFSVIQTAVSTAAPGDTIRIGPGQFDEFTFRSSPSECACVHVDRTGLTFIGSGREQTTIGSSGYVGVTVCGFSIYPADYQTRIENLGTHGLVYGVRAEDSDVVVANCEFDGCTYNGIDATGESALVVESCDFRSNSVGIDIFDGPILHASNCGFTGPGFAAIRLHGGTGHVVRDCDVQDLAHGVMFGSARGLIAHCRLAGAGPMIEVANCEVVTILGNDVSAESYAARFASSTAEVRGNVFNGGTLGCIVASSARLDMHGNHILNGGALSLQAEWYHYDDLTRPFDLDLTGNYWGTDDPAQIAAWIDDYNDHPPSDMSHWIIVNFDPFSPHEVSTEPVSWGALKCLFR